MVYGRTMRNTVVQPLGELARRAPAAPPASRCAASARRRAPARGAQLLEELGSSRALSAGPIGSFRSSAIRSNSRAVSRDELHPVVDEHPQLRVVEDALMDGVEVLLRDLDHVAVDLHHRHLLDRGMLERLL